MRFTNGFFHSGGTPATPADTGGEVTVLDIARTAADNQNYRTALWTGDHLQLTVMTIPPGGDIGSEIHPDTDQFFGIVSGYGTLSAGTARDRLTETPLNSRSVVLIPAGTWHNIINSGHMPLRLYTLYAPPHHPKGTVHMTKADALAEHD